MRRRRYLQAAAVGMSGLAGCNAWSRQNEPPPDTASETATATAIPTESPTATPRQEPRDVEPPAYMDLLPKPHLKGTEETSNANFVRVDWDWYLSNYDTEMRFGVTSDEDWTLEANAGNLNERPPPQYRLLHTPVGTTIQTAGLIANIIPLFPNLGPELVRQCGMEMVNESGKEDSRARYAAVESADVEEIVSYATPGFTFFIGVDVDSIKLAVQGNDQQTVEGYPDTVLYSAEGRMSGRGFFVSQAWDRPLLLVETADSRDEDVIPVFERVTGAGSTESAATLESVRWCLSEFLTDVPVQVGQINGGRAKFSHSTYVQSPIRSLRGYDTVFSGFDSQNGSSGTAQVVTSNLNGEPPTEDELRNLYGPEDGKVEAAFHPSVSRLSSNWGP
jgi:hypothetical protein